MAWRLIRNGFTLVELIVVIAMVAVLAGMAVPRISSLSGGRRLREDARQLQATAQYAREYAATRRVPCRLMLDVEQGRFSLACPAMPGASEASVSTGDSAFKPLKGWAGRPESLGEGVRFGELNISPRPESGEYGELIEADSPANCVTFTADGLADAAVVPLTDGKRTFSLLVSPGGQIRLVGEAVDKLPSDRIDLDE